MIECRTGLRRESARLAGIAALALCAVAQPASARPTGAAPAKAGHHFRDCASATCPEMVVIPPGAFTMGATGGEEGRPEGARHDVRIAYSFAVGTREVSNAEYARFIADSGYRPSGGCRSYDGATNTVAVRPDADFRHPGTGAGDGAPNVPAACISWTDAKAYVAWLSHHTGKPYRLLSEAEWEYVARAGSQAEYPWGDKPEDGCGFANTLDRKGAASGVLAVFGGTPDAAHPAVVEAACDDGYAGAAPGGHFRANAFGVQDMIGNVWEWVEDCYVAPYSADVPTDGRAYQVAGECPRRAVRGGSWITAPFRNRVAWRGRDPENLVTWIFGFRVARDLAGTAE